MEGANRHESKPGSHRLSPQAVHRSNGRHPRASGRGCRGDLQHQRVLRQISPRLGGQVGPQHGDGIVRHGGGGVVGCAGRGAGAVPSLCVPSSADVVPRVRRGDRASAAGAPGGPHTGWVLVPGVRRCRTGPRWARLRRLAYGAELLLLAVVMQLHGCGIRGEPVLPGRRPGYRHTHGSRHFATGNCEPGAYCVVEVWRREP